MKFTLRIRTEQEEDIDWSVNPDEITFPNVLEVISKILPGITTTAFQYVDEDGEKITVRSDDELKAMFEMYECEISEEDLARGTVPPLIIYPRIGKTPKDRNRYDLKIKTETGSSKPPKNQSSPFMPDMSHHKAKSSTEQFSKKITSPLHPLPGNQPFSQGSQLGYNSGSQQPTSPQPMDVPMTPQSIQIASLHQVSPQAVQIAADYEQQQMSSPTQTETDRRTGDMKQLLTGGTIDVQHLQQVEMIGSGNGGNVYKALHVPSQTFMAVKVIELDVDIEIQRKIILELDILHKCDSPSIIGFYGAFFIENRISICTEYMDGGSLERYGRIPEEILGRLAVRIIEGLLYMWSLKVLHRDIKPSNILVNTKGDVKLCDFGVSTQLVKSIAITYVGTNAYMAPERIKAENYGVPSEVWSLGVTLFELATGEFPFQEMVSKSNPGSMFNMILEGRTPVLPQDVFSPELSDFVARCMQKDPDRRITQINVLGHPLIQKYLQDRNISKVLSAWITSQLQLSKARSTQQSS
ncbi:dual specificity mitogen-activated protein kinase kinase 5-like [Mya arenaria]|uniref:dual specificity mitogen-activated protein kinase kinase 5-like n=1 Tax=Mya arenaria TaxID=6604 RepID=UPI0022E76067|nr:dual specificity mitogen-activated protein kinase kinase 5-like [Mya arenaria]